MAERANGQKRRRKVRIRWGRFLVSLVIAAALLAGIGFAAANAISGGAALGFVRQLLGGEGGGAGHQGGEEADGGAGDAGLAGSGAGEVQPEGADGADGTEGADGGGLQAGADDARPEAAPFKGLYYYESDKLDRYVAYAAEHSGLSAGDVVWRVNIKLDKPFYTDIEIIEDVYSLPVLVNKYYRLPDDFAPKEFAKIGGGYRVTPETAAAYESMAADAEAAGMALRPGSAYRTIEYQVNLYARYKSEDGEAAADTYSSRPGHSEHHTGRTIDLVGPTGTLNGFTGTEEAAWVAENAHKYGFIVRYTAENEEITGYMPESWHITYVGAEAAGTMKKENIRSLEEYMVKYVYHSQ
ncbi:MAG: M15 family metallopeptidase [Clostridiales Family XIII bacterium]|nr:M15 family metallopeptidase [Clostridiales Family XIII bacterium]